MLPRQTLLLLGLFAFLLGCPGPSEPPSDNDPPDMASGLLDPDEIPLKVSARCPGDPDCQDVGDQTLYAGYGERDITPEIEPFDDQNKNNKWDEGEPFTDTNKNGKFDAYWIAGYGNDRLALGVHDPTWARAIALKQNQTLVVIVSVDTLGLFRDETLAVQKLLDPRLGVDLLILHGTHVHQNADLVGGWGPDMFTNGINRYYQQRVRRLIAEAVADAVQQIRPARVTMNSVLVQDANGDMRRYVGDTRDPVVINPRLHTLQFVDISNTPPKPIATLVNWAHHPEGVGSSNQLITSDFVHVLRTDLEAAGSGKVVYVSGALGGQIGPGGVVPIDEKGTEYPKNSFEKSEWIGHGVARFAKTSMAAPDAVTVEGKAAKLSFRTTVFPLQVQNRLYHFALQLKVYQREVCCYDTTRSIDDGNFPSVYSQVSYLQLGPASIITNPGELLPELFIGGYQGEYAGKYTFIDTKKPNSPDVSLAPKPPYLIDLMDGNPKLRMTFGLSHDFVGYIVPRYNFLLDDKRPYFNEPPGDHYEETNSVGPLAEPQVVGTMRQLVLFGRTNPPGK